MENSLDKENTTKFWDAANVMHQAAIKESKKTKKKTAPKPKKYRIHRT